MVLHGMELLKQFGKDFGRFDAWLQALEKTLDGRGKMGSAVGASHDLKATGMVGAGDSQITQYMVCIISYPSSLILIKPCSSLAYCLSTLSSDLILLKIAKKGS